MSYYEEFSRRYYSEARRDLDRAQRALKERDFPETLFHVQQSVKKAVKSMIEAKKEYVYNHGLKLASIFARVFKDE
ncbi:MAG: HEPN domain-containing protein [Candidatus Asgardarchaeia archaeon]